MTASTRRNFLKGSVAATVGAIALSGLTNRVALADPGAGRAGRKAGKGEGGYGPLAQRPAENAAPGELGELALPAGFKYVKFGIARSIMSDGNATPNAHDGMAAFALPNGNIRLIRNHENRDSPGVATIKGSPATAYDQLGGGATTSLEIKQYPDGSCELVRDFISLNGTIVNCAGGPTPWGTWLTCEESVETRERKHGYVFEVPASAEDEVPAEPLTAMGRLVHEAVAVDPRTSIVYETEDRNVNATEPRAGAGFYRFIPAIPGNLKAGGRLQMLAIADQPNYDTVTGQRVGKPLPVTWVDIPDPDPADTNGFTAGDGLAVYRQGYEQGGARFARLEGAWYGEGSVFFHSTNGGDARRGQVWQYTPRGNSGGQLVLLFESPSAEVLDAPDNITISPRGGLVLCEDGGGVQYLRGLTQRGQIFDFALNLRDDDEFAGACFSPNGQTLFVNLIGSTREEGDLLGMSFAIWGPWDEGAL